MALITSLVSSPAPKNGRFTVSKASFLRPDNTTAYAVGDVMSDSNVDARAIAFPGVGRSGLIHHASLIHHETDAVAFTLLLFDAEPTNFTDNAALNLDVLDGAKLLLGLDFLDANGLLLGATDQVNYMRFTNLTVPAFRPVSYVTETGLLYGLLVVQTVFTPAAERRIDIRLSVERDTH